LDTLPNLVRVAEPHLTFCMSPFSGAPEPLRFRQTKDANSLPGNLMYGEALDHFLEDYPMRLLLRAGDDGRGHKIYKNPVAP
jgi:hypothetical protein